MRRSMAAMAAGLILLAGCGDDDDGGEDGGGSSPLAGAVEKTEAAGTARMDFEVTIEGEQDLSFSGDGQVDFENDRDLLTVTVQGQTLQLFSDAGEEYVRQGTSGRYQPAPASSDSPVANNPADSLQYLGSDITDVEEGDDADCYEGKLDFDRIFERIEEGREDEFPGQLRGQQAPVVVCLDGEGRIRRYDVSLELEGNTLETKSTFSDHGTAPALEPLGPDELPE